MNKKIKILIILLLLFSYKNIYAETINNHSTMSHTKQQIIDKYNSTRSRFNYSDSVYKENPNTSIPYREGSLKEQVEQDVLNNLNFYRWLAGLNEVSLNSNRQSANQKGALIMAVNNALSHYPSRPNGMDDSFYNDGYAACGSKSNTWQGNISNGYRIDTTPEAFITDNTNVESNVAHRSSLLNPKAKQVSFGYVNRYATMSIHYDNTNNNPDSYNPWPPAGYFPVEVMDQDYRTRWSIYLGNYSMTSNTKVVLTYNNNSYIVNRNSLYFTDYSRNMYYSIPSELRTQITNNNIFKKGIVINVKIENLVKNNTNYTINYDIKPFSINERQVEKIDLNKHETTIEVLDEEYLSATITPNENVDKTITWESSNNNIVTVDNNGMIKGINTGTATITVKSSNGKIATCKVNVTEPTKGVSYTTHVENIGWQSYKRNGEMSGTSGQSLRLEGIKIRLKGLEYSGNIEYRTHIENIGWESSYKRNGEMSGTSGQSLRLEAIQIKLNGKVSNYYDVYYRVHSQEFGWLGWAKNGEAAGTAGYAYRLEAIEIKLIEKNQEFSEYGKTKAFKDKNNQEIPKVETKNTSVSYTTHVENIGWQDYVKDGKTAGTSGQSLRLEGIKIKLQDQEYDGNILYKTHIQYLGWEDNYKKNNEMSGTSGQSLRLEAIQIKLDGDISDYYDVYYRVHSQEFGWLGWAKNGESAGTAGYAYRLEAIEIKLIEKDQEFSDYGKIVAFKDKDDEKIPSVSYTTHVENIGWQDYVKDGEMAGTQGQSLRLEGIKIKLEDQKYSGNIEYKTHVQNIGWQDYVKNNEMSGTSGKSLRLEAIQIKLTGEIANHYDIYYRVHAQNIGWMNWAKNDEKSGTAGYSYRLEGIEIVIVKKGETPKKEIEKNTNEAFTEKE